MFVIEVAGLLIRHVVLAVRLFANMFAGHVVLAVILGFILMAWGRSLFFLVMAASIIGVILLSLLELFVAFLQAYIFTLLVGAVHRLGGPSALSGRTVDGLCRPTVRSVRGRRRSRSGSDP